MELFGSSYNLMRTAWLYGTVRYGTVRYSTARHGKVRYGTVRYVLYGFVLYQLSTTYPLLCFGRSCADGRFVVEYVSVVLVGRSGSVVLCTAGLEDMAVALSPGKCGSYRQILSNNSVSRWL